MFKAFWKYHLWNSNFLCPLKTIHMPGNTPLNTKPILSENSLYVVKYEAGLPF